MGILKERLIKRMSDRKAGNFTEIKERLKDPVKWEVTYWRLLGIVGEGREIARQISASPTVKEFGECVFAIFTPEGESIGFSRGILLHMASMGSAIQWMLMNDYEEDPGINPGDIFFNNDPQLGGAHAADQALLLPVNYQGEMVAWVGGLTHCMEVGATEPGAMPPSALSRYDDGQMIPCMKVGTNYKFNRDYHIMVDRNTRDGKWWILDDKAKLAGLIRMIESLTKLIDEIGMEYFKTVCMEMIEEGRQSAIRKIRTVLFPGRYRSITHYDIPFADPMQRIRIPKDYMMYMPMEMTIDAEGRMIFDMEGITSAEFHSNNSSWPCTLGNMIYTLLQDCFYDGMYNNGMEDAFTVKLRENSCLNVGKEYACSIWASAGLTAAMNLTRCLAMAYYAMGYREEGFASKGGTGAILVGGIDQFGLPFGIMNFEMNCSGMGASHCLDGLHAAGAPWNPEANLSDAEMFEHVWPLIWLGRNLLKDGGGFGRKQGGTSISSLYVIEHDVKFIESGGMGSYEKCVGGSLMGGYPAHGRYKYALVDTDYKEKVMAMAPLPHGEGDDPANPEFAQLLKGTLKRYPAQHATDQYKRYDILHQFSHGGGGWGDPIERDPQAVVDDLKMDVISEYTARNIYCVAWNPETMEVDYQKTEALRREMRQKRLQRGIPVSEYKRWARERILAGDMPPVPKASYNDAFAHSEKFLKEFREYWNLPESFKGF